VSKFDDPVDFVMGAIYNLRNTSYFLLMGFLLITKECWILSNSFLHVLVVLFMWCVHIYIYIYIYICEWTHRLIDLGCKNILAYLGWILVSHGIWSFLYHWIWLRNFFLFIQTGFESVALFLWLICLVWYHNRSTLAKS
jgi:hypothetical protein